LSRGPLEATAKERISKELPDLSKLQDLVLRLSSDFLSINFTPESTVPEASVCLNDALRTLGQAVYALSEVFAHQVWYLDKKDPPNKMAAVFFGLFYADDAALRLYSAGEHLANGIILMLEITDEDLQPYKKKGSRERISQQSVVGHFLREQKADHPITAAINKLIDSKKWCATMCYRNTWVHEQPPTVKGLGIIYKRKKNKTRWKPSLVGEGYTLKVGGGDVPEYSIKELIRFIQPAMFQFTDTLTSVVNFYMKLLEDSGGVRFNLKQEVNNMNKMPQLRVLRD